MASSSNLARPSHLRPPHCSAADVATAAATRRGHWTNLSSLEWSKLPPCARPAGRGCAVAVDADREEQELWNVGAPRMLQYRLKSCVLRAATSGLPPGMRVRLVGDSLSQQAFQAVACFLTGARERCRPTPLPCVKGAWCDILSVHQCGESLSFMRLDDPKPDHGLYHRIVDGWVEDGAGASHRNRSGLAVPPLRASDALVMATGAHRGAENHVATFAKWWHAQAQKRVGGMPLLVWRSPIPAHWPGRYGTDTKQCKATAARESGDADPFVVAARKTLPAAIGSAAIRLVDASPIADRGDEHCQIHAWDANDRVRLDWFKAHGWHPVDCVHYQERGAAVRYLVRALLTALWSPCWGRACSGAASTPTLPQGTNASRTAVHPTRGSGQGAAAYIHKTP